MKTVVITGITGNQDGSFAKVLLQSGDHKIRGVARDTGTLQSVSWKERGVEIVQGDLNDVSTLISAFRRADFIFGTTAYPSQALKPGMQKASYELEYQQGRNIADAAATIQGLKLFIWSSLSASTKWSKGKYSKVYQFDSKAHVVDYIEERLPGLFITTSILQMGLFMDNWKGGKPFVPWEKLPEGSLRLAMAGHGEEPVPSTLGSDAGSFAYALLHLPPQTKILGFGDRVPWSEFVKLLARKIGVTVKLDKVSVEEQARVTPGGFGEEMAEMYGYMNDFGYHGGDPSIVPASEVQLDFPVTRL